MVKIKDITAEKMYMNWCMVYAVWVVGFAYVLAWILPVPLRHVPVDLFSSVLGIHPPVSLFLVGTLAIFLYYVLHRLDHEVQNMNKYTVGMYLLICTWILHTIVGSVVNWSFTFGKVGVFHIAVVFVGAGLYTVKNRGQKKVFPHKH